MPEIILTRNDEGKIVGLSDANKRAWARVKNQLTELDIGEIFRFKYDAKRMGPFHRFHMKFESTVFESQERIEHFEMFRDWLKVGSGFVVWMAGPKGGVIPIPKSISYAECDEDEMREFHRSSVDFLRGAHAPKYLWPHLTPEAAAEMMRTVIEPFERRS
jgi:hypothetical protein